jgi:hypothetical protein
MGVTGRQAGKALRAPLRQAQDSGRGCEEVGHVVFSLGISIALGNADMQNINQRYQSG